MTDKPVKTPSVILNRFGYQIARLIDVKSIITIALAFTLIAVVLSAMEIPQRSFDLFSNATMLCLGFFFGKNLKNETPEGD